MSHIHTGVQRVVSVLDYSQFQTLVPFPLYGIKSKVVKVTHRRVLFIPNDIIN